MRKKTVIILEILALLIAAVVYFMVEVLPDIKKSLGSSDHFVNTKKYQNMVEFNIDNNIGFALLVSDEKKIYHIFFYNKNARCLYNQNIEENSIDDSISKVVKILIQSGYLNNNSNIKLTRYNDKYYEDIKNSLEIALDKYNIKNEVIWNTNTLVNRAKELGINEDGDDRILYSIDLYSRDSIKLNVGEKEEINNTSVDVFTLCNNVYTKIDNYVKSHNIKDLSQDNTDLVITLIPADENGNYYPSSKSVYYVKDYKVYAYIEIENIGYCYKGSINNYKKGECS